ncbi:MAG: alkaline phosphatase D family protein [Alphaproteobacteria bacterium]
MVRLFALFSLIVVGSLPLSAQPREPATFTRIAFASCADQKDPQPLWDALFAYRPDLFLFIGDNVYGSAPRAALTAEMPVLREAYRLADAQAPYQRVRRDLRTMAIWDDHDFGLNDGGADHPFKAEAKALFLDFWRVPENDPRRSREGLYFAEIFGPPGRRIQVIMLDTRWFRSPLERGEPRPGPGPYRPTQDRTTTVLGEAQWAWLADELRKPADLRILVSSIQVLAENHAFERWGNFPHERERLLATLRDSGAENLLILSGDRHLAGLYRDSTALPYPLVEATSSPITRPFPAAAEAGPNHVGAIYGMENFGTLDVDWWAREIAIAIRNVPGEPVRRLVVKFEDLKKR